MRKLILSFLFIIITLSFIQQVKASTNWSEIYPPGGTAADKKWRVTASDDDASVQIAGIHDGRIYLTTDSGSTWNETQPAGATNIGWTHADIDSDGSVIVVDSDGSTHIWGSTNGGSSWSQFHPNGYDGFYQGLAIDSDGSFWVIGKYSDTSIYYSTNSGASWSSWSSAVTGLTYCARGVAVDSDGSVIVAVNQSDDVFYSTNSGTSWASVTVTGASNLYYVHVSSDGGTIMVADSNSFSGPGRIYKTTNWSSWTEMCPSGSCTDYDWKIDMSNSGSVMIAGAYNNRLWTSTDTGATWEEQQPGGDSNHYWATVDVSGDGTKFLAGVGSGSFNGRLYSGTTPTPPSTPTGLSGTANSTSQITWSWNEASGATSYTVHDSSHNPLTGCSAIATTSCVQSGLSANTQYTVHVYATNGDGNSAETSNASKYTLPNPPTGLTFSSINWDYFTISWTASSGGAWEYQAYRDGYLAGSVSNSPYYHTVAANSNHLYSYDIYAVNSDGVKSATALSGSVYSGAATPLAPTLSTVSSSSIKVVVNTNGNPSITTYSIKVGTQYIQSNGTPTSSAALGASPVYQTYANWNSTTGVSITGLTSGTQYTVSVDAKNNDGIATSYSATASQYTLPDAPGSFSGAASSISAITWSWSSVTDATSYTVYNSSEVAVTGCSAVATTSCSESSLSANALRGPYHVHATGNGGTSAASATASKYTLSNTPGALTLTAGLGQMQSSWTSGGSQTGYNLYYSGDGYASPIYTGTNTSYTKTGLSDNTQYTFKVYSYNGDSVNSASAQTTAKYTYGSTPISVLASVDSSTEITVTWSSGGAQAGYRVYYSGDNYVSAIYDNTGTTYQKTGLTPSTEYTFRVYSYNTEIVQSTAYNSDTETTSGGGPSKPTGVSAAASSPTVLQVTWSTVGDATSYKIFRDDSGCSSAIATGVTGTTYDDTIGVNTTHTYKVKATNIYGDSSCSDASSAIYSLANTPGTPILSSATTSSIKVQWDENSNPSSTTYWLKTGSQYVQADGTLGGSPVYQTFGTWAGTAGVTVTGLTINTTYAFTAYARNGDSVATSGTTSSGLATLTLTPSTPTLTPAANKITVAWTANGNSAGTEYQIERNDSTTSTWTTDTSWEDTSAAECTAYTYRVRSRNLNSVESASSSYSASGTRSDSTAPVVATLTSSTHASQSTWYSTAAPAFSWSYTEGCGLSTSYAYYYLLDTTATQTNATVVSTGTGTNTASVTLPAQTSGTYYFHLVAKDSSDNKSDTSNYTLKIDTAWSGVVSITTSATVTSANISITISATDNLSGAYQMRFSNNGSLWSDWETYANTKSAWPLTNSTYGGSSSTGAKTVYAQFKDTAGNTSTNATASLTYSPVAVATSAPAMGGSIKNTTTQVTTTPPPLETIAPTSTPAPPMSAWETGISTVLGWIHINYILENVGPAIEYTKGHPIFVGLCVLGIILILVGIGFITGKGKVISPSVSAGTGRSRRNTKGGADGADIGKMIAAGALVVVAIGIFYLFWKGYINTDQLMSKTKQLTKGINLDSKPWVSDFFHKIVDFIDKVAGILYDAIVTYSDKAKILIEEIITKSWNAIKDIIGTVHLLPNKWR